VTNPGIEGSWRRSGSTSPPIGRCAADTGAQYMGSPLTPGEH
jgi:hypothetical protein